MKNVCIIFSLLALISLSCSKDDIAYEEGNPLTGTWKYTNFSDNMYVFSRSESFIDGPCYRFNNNGTLTERKNSGFCGTPPITYADYPGTWSRLNDTIIKITAGYWGGSTTYSLDIESVDVKTLKFSIIYDK